VDRDFGAEPHRSGWRGFGFKANKTVGGERKMFKLWDGSGAVIIKKVDLSLHLGPHSWPLLWGGKKEAVSGIHGREFRKGGQNNITLSGSGRLDHGRCECVVRVAEGTGRGENILKFSGGETIASN